jgi:hypothetical protein
LAGLNVVCTTPFTVYIPVVPAVCTGNPPVKVIVAAFLHIGVNAASVTIGVGFTVMVKLFAVPTQVTPPLVKLGVTVMVATTGAWVILVPTNDGIFPVPVAAKPMLVALFVQLYTIVPPVVGLLKFTAVVGKLLHNTWLVILFTVAVGFTVYVYVFGVPTQLTPPLVNVGVTVIVAVTGAVVVFVAVKLGIFPVPDATSPMLVVLFVQLYTIVPPVVGLVNVTAVLGLLLQSTWLATAVTVAVGFTVYVYVRGVPTQLTPPLVNVGVTVIVAVTGAVVVFVAVKLGMLPVPDAPSPILVVLFVQL